MEYLPQEGVDYITNLYAVVGVAPNSESDDIKRMLNQRALEYHPDRLHGLADEFVVKGDRMIRLLNRARGILLDPESRQVYDGILGEWEGPISDDGAPIMTMDRYLRSRMADKTPEEIEDLFAEQAKRAEALLGYRPSRLALIENYIASAGDTVPDDLRAEYEDALLSLDRFLAIQEAERSELLGLPSTAGTGNRASLDHVETITDQLAEAKSALAEQAQLDALGGVAKRLALLAGDTDMTQDHELELASVLEVPIYFDQQADKIRALAAQRQEVVAKRLANMKPEYPMSEKQTEASNQLLIGLKAEEVTWIGVAIDLETCSAEIQMVAPGIETLLNEGDLEAVIGSGYNVLTFTILEQIDINDQLFTVIEKHAERYGIGG